jgi:hypothetical protein
MGGGIHLIEEQSGENSDYPREQLRKEEEEQSKDGYEESSESSGLSNDDEGLKNEKTINFPLKKKKGGTQTLNLKPSD